MRKKHTYLTRSTLQAFIDFLFFPIRAFTLFEDDKFHLTSLRSERFYYVASQTKGYTLDVGCGKENMFISKFLKGNGRGIDIFPYKGLKAENLLKSLDHFPAKDNSFDSVTFIASINHCPKPKRNAEIKESFRVLKSHGNVIITMGNPFAELIVHKVVYYYDKFLGTNVDMDTERGMDKDEDYYLTDTEIINLLKTAGFKNIKKHYFWTQWFLNHMFVANKS